MRLPAGKDASRRRRHSARYKPPLRMAPGKAAKPVRFKPSSGRGGIVLGSHGPEFILVQAETVAAHAAGSDLVEQAG